MRGFMQNKIWLFKGGVRGVIKLGRLCTANATFFLLTSYKARSGHGGKPWWKAIVKALYFI